MVRQNPEKMGKRLNIHWLETGDTRGLYQKFCFMESASRGEIEFRVRPRSAYVEFGFDESDVPLFKEGFSFFRVVWGNYSILVVLDNKDSFFNISPLVRKADLYFLGAYSPTIIEGKCFPEPYSWQTETDLAPYRLHFKRVVEQFGDSFAKIVRSIPMPMIMHPSLHRGAGVKFSSRRFALVACTLAMDRWARRWHRPMNPLFEKTMYSIRYKELLALRNQQLEYDIVSSDTLWAWPEHRARLYYEISNLSDQMKVLTRLSAPRVIKSWSERLSPKMLEFVNGQLGSEQAVFQRDFERLFAASRLNILACGKHWGWRQLGYIALLCGNPILMDKPLFMPYFPFDDFAVTYTKDQWQELPDMLASIDESAWCRIKKKNQHKFDRYLAPGGVSQYMLSVIKTKIMEQHAS